MRVVRRQLKLPNLSSIVHCPPPSFNALELTTVASILQCDFLVTAILGVTCVVVRASNDHHLFDVPDEQMMAKENQAVTGELARLGAERDENRRKLGDALHQQATSEQVCMHMEKSDRIGNEVPIQERSLILYRDLTVELLLKGNTSGSEIGER